MPFITEEIYCTLNPEEDSIMIAAWPEMYENSKKSFANLAFAKEIHVQQDKTGIGEDAVSVVVSNAVVYMPLEDLVDKEKELERLTKEQERLTKEIARCEGMLNNPNFVNKAPAAKVDAEKDRSLRSTKR